MLSAYNGTRSAVTGYSPYFLLFGRKSRMPVDYLFPTLHDPPHQTRMEVSVAAMQKRLKEAFAVARQITSQEVAKQRRYYDRKAGAVTLQPGDVVMVCTDGFMGKRKVKDQWEDGGFVVESQLEDWPMYKVRCPTSDAKQKPKYWILHRNHLLLVTSEDDNVVLGQLAQADVNSCAPNAPREAIVVKDGSSEPLPSLVTRQEGDMTSWVWLNGEFRTKPWTQTKSEAPKCAWSFLQVFLFLILSCMECALVWGNCHERLRVEIFVRVLCSSEVISLILCKMIQTGFACVAMSPLLQFTFHGTITVIGLTMQFLTSISLVVS